MGPDRYLQRFPSAGQVFLPGGPEHEERRPGDHLPLGPARPVRQVQRLQRDLQVGEEILGGPDAHEVSAAQDLQLRACRRTDSVTATETGKKPKSVKKKEKGNFKKTEAPLHD